MTNLYLQTETIWLTLTNVFLGLITIACIIVVIHAIMKELKFSSRKDASSHMRQDEHAINLKGLGITLADGGKKIDEGSLCRNVPKKDNPPDRPDPEK